ncbi:MAG: hypothetical protein ACJ797_20110 [Ktedonobacteraceae bacterium]
MAVALPNLTVKWVQPSLFWSQSSPMQTTPLLAEFDTDQFMPKFLDMMAGNIPVALTPPADTILTPIVDGLPDGLPQQAFKLYLPFHRRYYLVTGSLVCRHLGLPDHTVNRKNGEKVSFVLRRFIAVNGVPVEHGWIDKGPQKGWNPVAANKLLVGEERQPMSPVKVQPPPLSGTPSFKDVRANTVAPADRRVIYHGYVPASSREKYLTPVANAAQLIQDAITNSAGTLQPVTDPRLDEITSRVIGLWLRLLTAGADQPPLKKMNPPPGPPTLEEMSLLLLADLGDFLQTNLNEVFKALIAGTDLPSDGTFVERQNLLASLRQVHIWFYPGGVANSGGQGLFLSQALNNLKKVLGLAHGQGDEPADDYNVVLNVIFPAPTPLDYLRPPPPFPPELGVPAGTKDPGILYKLFSAALTEDRRNKKNWLTLPPEVAESIKVESVNGDVYFLRLVYEHDPCEPLLSDPSPVFTFAKFFDPDAPARPVRIELPSIKPKDLRKYKRGVGLQFSPELNNLISRVNTKMLQGGPLSPADPNGANLSIAFICSFSISITFLVAIIVMFIFLILFNIIFWWLAFIRICFPIPIIKK